MPGAGARLRHGGQLDPNDGIHDHQALIEKLTGLVAQGTLVAQENGVPVTDPERIRGTVKEALDKTLPTLARLASLMA